MKAIPQNALILIGCIVVALVILGIFGLYTAKAPLQRQIIYIFDESSLKLSNPYGLIKISEIKPNSAVSFYYPDPDRFKNRDPFEQFILIRLPDYLGGTVNDASAFRAYSALDPTSHCLVKYWPQEGRRKIEDSCSGNMYDPASGYASTNFGHSVLVSKNVALPYLTISLDENGLLYIEPPVWTDDKNGVVGIGRAVSEKEIESANQLNASREKYFREAMEGFTVPDSFSTGHKLDHIGGDGIRTNLAEYFVQDSSPIMLLYGYCNCTKSKELLADEEMTRTNSQILDVDGVPVVAYPNAVIDYVNQIYDKYVFVFYYDGYRIALHTNQKLDAGLTLVKELLDFEKMNSDSIMRSFTYQIDSFEVSVTIANGSINKITKLDDTNSIFIEMSSFNQGYLITHIPRTMLKALNDDYSKFSFFVISDGEETVYEQIDPETIKINFENNTGEIEIVGISKLN